MKKTLLILLLSFSVFSYSSEINGSVTLDNTSDNSGVIIKFNPISPSAVYADGTSDLNGLYNITVINGLYDISFEKNGYQTYTLNNQFISTDNTLTNVTLNSNEVINISGNVSGNWTNTNTYIVNGNTTIPKGQTLNIEQGTEIKFSGYYSLIVNGTINAIGNENNYIKFTSNNTSPTNKDWNQIQINPSSNLSKLKYCIIEYGKEDNSNDDGIVNVGGELDIENCIVRDSEAIGISVKGNTLGINILNNEISNCSVGILIGNDTSAMIDGNKVSNINEIGIVIHLNSHTTTVSNNQVSNCFYGIASFSNILIRNNILFNINGYAIYTLGGQPTIRNNTIFSNGSGIGIDDSDFWNPNPIINSNIISNNNFYGIKTEGEQMPSLVTYNLFYNNSSGTGNNLPAGVGTVITTNSNGTDSDTYFNIFSSPNLMSINTNDTNFCELNTNSDAINAGDPSISNSSNSTIIDIGAKESSGTLSINEFVNNNFTISPNPIISHVKIKTKNNQLFNKIILYSINGRTIKKYNLESPSNEYRLENLNNLKSGIYIMSIYNVNDKIKRVKLIKK
tara:strand:- start:297 stop:1991 length:1695 start_codon:yes stop_codon:yes gene_type:complete